MNHVPGYEPHPLRWASVLILKDYLQGLPSHAASPGDAR